MEVKLIFVLIAGAAIAQTPEATFQSRCATCHSVGNLMGAPPPETLRKMSSKAILAALETGRMSTIGAGLMGHGIAYLLQTAIFHRSILKGD